MFELTEVDGMQYVQLKENAQLDFEEVNAYTFEVRATSTSSWITSTANILVSVLNQDEPPVFELPPNKQAYELSMAENATPGSIVGQISASDPEGGNVNYNLLDKDDRVSLDENFQINSQDGTISVKEGTLLDYEDRLRNNFNLKIQATSGIHKASIDAYITVSDLNEAPVFTFAPSLSAYHFEIAENAAAGTKVVGPMMINATDPEEGIVTYTLLGANEEVIYNGPFNIIETNNYPHIQLQASGILDYETVPSLCFQSTRVRSR